MVVKVQLNIFRYRRIFIPLLEKFKNKKIMKTIYIQRTVEYLLSIQHSIPPNGEVRETEKGVKYYILSDDNKI